MKILSIKEIIESMQKGIGRSLVKTAVKYTRGISESHSLYLTSNPSRTAARNLYRSEGFEKYNTGVFRII